MGRFVRTSLEEFGIDLELELPADAEFENEVTPYSKRLIIRSEDYLLEIAHQEQKSSLFVENEIKRRKTLSLNQKNVEGVEIPSEIVLESPYGFVSRTFGTNWAYILTYIFVKNGYEYNFCFPFATPRELTKEVAFTVFESLENMRKL